MKTVVVAGATGLVGTELCNILHANGFNVVILSTRKNFNHPKFATYYWQPQNQYIAEGALENAHTIINLAGANINEKWTPQYKQKIYDSRTRSAETLFKYVAKNNIQLTNYFSSSGIGIYPSSYTKTFTENAKPGNQFLSQVCQAWEHGANQFAQLGARVVVFRTGMVLSRAGGALPLLEKITKWGVASPIGSGKQWVSWIHCTDLCNLILFALQNTSVSGPLNAVAPQPVTNTVLTKMLAKQLNRPVFLPNVPTAALRILLGERAVLATESHRASAEKAEQLGFVFKFPNLPAALQNLYS